MNLFSTPRLDSPEETAPTMSRRSLFKHASVIGATTAVALSGFPTIAKALGIPQSEEARASATSSSATTGDMDIVSAAQIAEALAVTMYSEIVYACPFFTRLPAADQDYFYGARQEEMSHYDLLMSVTGKPSPFTSFYYPKNMFKSPQVTLDTLVLLEEAFIAAYIVGIRNFSTVDYRITAARIMGVESDHRTLARVVGGDIASADGGPVTKIMGAQNTWENIMPANNNGYERTLCWTDISQAVAALMPFLDKTAAAKAGFDTTKTFSFQAFTPNLPAPNGAFKSFTGC